MAFDVVVHGVDVLFVIGLVVAVILGVMLVGYVFEHVTFVWDVFAGIKEWWDDRHD
jgi:hypothetical protein